MASKKDTVAIPPSVAPPYSACGARPSRRASQHAVRCSGVVNPAWWLELGWATREDVPAALMQPLFLFSADRYHTRVFTVMPAEAGRWSARRSAAAAGVAAPIPGWLDPDAVLPWPALAAAGHLAAWGVGAGAPIWGHVAAPLAQELAAAGPPSAVSVAIVQAALRRPLAAAVLPRRSGPRVPLQCNDLAPVRRWLAQVAAGAAGGSLLCAMAAALGACLGPGVGGAPVSATDAEAALQAALTAVAPFSTVEERMEWEALAMALAARADRADALLAMGTAHGLLRPPTDYAVAAAAAAGAGGALQVLLGVEPDGTPGVLPPGLTADGVATAFTHAAANGRVRALQMLLAASKAHGAALDATDAGMPRLPGLGVLLTTPLEALNAVGTGLNLEALAWVLGTFGPGQAFEEAATMATSLKMRSPDRKIAQWREKWENGLTNAAEGAAAVGWSAGVAALREAGATFRAPALLCAALRGGTLRALAEELGGTDGSAGAADVDVPWEAMAEWGQAPELRRALAAVRWDGGHTLDGAAPAPLQVPPPPAGALALPPLRHLEDSGVGAYGLVAAAAGGGHADVTAAVLAGVPLWGVDMDDLGGALDASLQLGHPSAAAVLLSHVAGANGDGKAGERLAALLRESGRRTRSQAAPRGGRHWSSVTPLGRVVDLVTVARDRATLSSLPRALAVVLCGLGQLPQAVPDLAEGGEKAVVGAAAALVALLGQFAPAPGSEAAPLAVERQAVARGMLQVLLAARGMSGGGATPLVDVRAVRNLLGRNARAVAELAAAYGGARWAARRAMTLSRNARRGARRRK